MEGWALHLLPGPRRHGDIASNGGRGVGAGGKDPPTPPLGWSPGLHFLAFQGLRGMGNFLTILLLWPPVCQGDGG